MSNLLLITAPPSLNLVEDVPEYIPHPFLAQARRFMLNGTHPSMFYKAVAKSLPQVPGVDNKDAMLLLDAVEVRYVNLVNTEFQASNAARANKDVKAAKPVDIYRKYNKDLRAIWKRGGQTSEAAHLLLVDLELEQTQSWGDLETPDYLDGYTSEPVIETDDPHEFIDQLIKHNRSIGFLEIIAKLGTWAEDDGFTGKAPYSLVSGYRGELIRQANDCRRTLGWGDREVEAFLRAQGAFDAESCEPEEAYDDVDPYTPPTMLEKELVLNRELWSSARDAVDSFYTGTSRIFEEMKEAKVKSQLWHSTFRSKLLASWNFSQMVTEIARIAREDIVTAAALYLSLAGDYKLMPEDVKDIRGVLPNASEAVQMSLLDFADAWEDDLLGLKQDSLHKSSPTSESVIEQADILTDRTVKNAKCEMELIPAAVRASMPKLHPNPIMTADWNIGFARAVANGASLPEAEAAGWDAWRLAMDPNAAKIYNDVLKSTESRRAAQAAFWKACDKRVPRPQQKVAAVKRDGLKLDDGRVINWWLAGLKIRQDELDLGISGDARYILNLKEQQARLGLSDDCVAWLIEKAGVKADAPTTPAKVRLLAKLQELGVGQQVWELLK